VLPDIPTVTEFVPGYEFSFWTGIGAPRRQAQYRDQCGFIAAAPLALADG